MTQWPTRPQQRISDRRRETRGEKWADAARRKNIRPRSDSKSMGRSKKEPKFAVDDAAAEEEEEEEGKEEEVREFAAEKVAEAVRTPR